jgi:mRNA-degrading endonuclease RelE of RelBE toxin-antitoxin system
LLVPLNPFIESAIPMDIDSVRSVTAGLEEARKGRVDYTFAAFLASELKDIWNAQPPIREEGIVYKKRALSRRYDDMLGPKPAGPLPKRPPPWFVGMSSAFSKDIVNIDRTLQGRILEALVEITENPTEVRGDTVKPLTGHLRGCWRYRVGGYRIIYSPNKTTGDITLLAFDSRGSAYAA